MSLPQLPPTISRGLQAGQVIPAHPLALNKHRKLDERRQRALTRYYLAAGARGLAVAVHTTQFEIRKPENGLLQPVLELASLEIDNFINRTKKPIIKIAGVVGKTAQARQEADLAFSLGYHAVLISLAAFPTATNATLIQHCREVAEIMPVIGFYLQPAVGGRRLDVDFWRSFAQIENAVAIKIAPFNRYQTLDVLRGVAESERATDIALYTGNDDNIVADLLTTYSIPVNRKSVKLRMVGGLLGHWAVWTKMAVALLRAIKMIRTTEIPVLSELLDVGIQITDCNAAFFDAANNFYGCIVGIQEVLRRQGLLAGNWTLNPEMRLSLPQKAAIDRVYAAYPHLNDDRFVAENLDQWLL